MLKEQAKQMIQGKTVESSWTGEVYKLVEDMKGAKGTVKAVALNVWGRYTMLTAWVTNWDRDAAFRARFGSDIEKCRAERLNYEVELKISDVVPHDKVRFVTSTGKTLFEARDLSWVKVDGRMQQVVYIDDYHFKLGRGDVFHIYQFAEICESRNIDVQPAA